MKLLLAALLLTTAVPAIGADMPVKAPPRTIEQGATWTGFYLFGYGGYGWGKMTPDDFSVTDLVEDFHNPKPKGTVFGFGGGYNWQSGRFVGGVEVDYGFANLKDDQSVSADILSGGEEPVVIGTATLSLKSKIDALGSARVRAGFLLADSFLIYGTGGLGFARSSATVTFSETFPECAECGGSAKASAKANNFGWVAGGGAEWQMMPYLRLRGEYLHYDFGSTSYAFQTPLILGVNVNVKTTADVARGALIWSFN